MKVNRKIHIIGSVGSGKTTLARKLSAQVGIPHYELDNVVWERGPQGDRRRTEKERDALFQEIIASDCWIIEGVHHTWIMESLRLADQIILLDPPYSQRTYRIIKRFIKQKLHLEKANYKPTFNMFRKMFRWNRYFETVSKPEIVELLKPYEEKLHVLEEDKKMPEIMEVLV
ncbi:DNA topology modulation protein FlaR [Bacillus sp. UMB0728]|uniref:DNA topology modulation protein FlaR n=1 Tax=Bacillus sp. UMB0728 TaxID=2066052 RepID=UPI000C769657|nr:DNA topology modulation protein FlaR [Bacillus sp. UMB0728]PLR74713.1 DNA topology modulation protein FlaR [Bacillus sp. UMB0728]